MGGREDVTGTKIRKIERERKKRKKNNVLLTGQHVRRRNTRGL